LLFQKVAFLGIGIEELQEVGLIGLRNGRNLPKKMEGRHGMVR
jgi:hypothetical protein